MSNNHRQTADDRLTEQLRAYGCPDLVRLDRSLSEPDQLEYLDLLPKRKSSPEIPLAGVAEHQGTPLLYVVDATDDLAVDAQKLARLQHQLANRSAPAWLGVVRPGSLEIHPIGFNVEAATTALDEISIQEERAPLFFQQLVHGTYEKKNLLPAADYVFNKIFSLLADTHAAFVPRTDIDPIHVLSMAGRALFWRFLIDRGIVLPDERTAIAPAADDLKDCFSSAEKAAQTSAWLDETFNGDFLPLIDESIPSHDRPAREAAYLSYYRSTGETAPTIFQHLHAILRGWSAVGGGHQTELEFDWGDLDFAHIPVGVLSQVYENFSHRLDAASAQKKSVHYTPRLIAQLMVDQVFAAARNPAEARVLDPACGASIFLVLAFRRLVRERWQRDDKRPDADTIRSILYEQLCGFDVSEAALRLSALSLYITAIEVNGTPRPPRSLRFPKNLRNSVLFCFAEPAAERASDAFEIGSLGSAVPAEFDGAFDIVIGNPPWTRLRDDEDEDSDQTGDSDVLNSAFTEIGRRVLKNRKLAEFAASYENPGKNPDLPFVWRAAEWARPNGLIAFALPARLFGRTSGKGFEAWRAVLHGVSVTGIVNGADLRWSSVWEGVKVPFCLFFARNNPAPQEHQFYYTTPLNEPRLNSQSRFRIDYERTQPVSVERIERQPWLLKTLSLGTWRDVEVMDQLLGKFPRTLIQIWTEWDHEGERTGKGYAIASKGKMAQDFLADLPDFSEPAEGFSIPTRLPRFKNRYGDRLIERRRTKALYLPPLIVIAQSPGDDPTKPRAYRSDQPLAFSQSFYGYSCAGHPEGDTLASLLYLIPHSTLFAYFCLMTSRRTGFDRQTFNKEELDALPFPDVTTLDARTRKKLRDLAHRLENDAEKPWDEIDEALFALYGLDGDAVQVARDTLFSAAAYRRQGKAALERTTRDSRASFRETLRAELEPFFDVCGEHVAVTEPDFQLDSWAQPWTFVAITREGEPAKVSAALLRKAMQVANERSASRIVVKLPGRAGLLLGLLNEQRWWTVTRAQLCAQHLVRHHLAVFDLTDAA